MTAKKHKASKPRYTLNTNAENPHGTGQLWSWLKFFIFFALGAIAGFSGGFLWFDEVRPHAIFAITSASVVGVLGGRFGDRATGLIKTILDWVH